ncbi:MAG: primosomal protein N' [Acidobacteria bacterium]|nr:primosomal protein N' [Acidobacteriota bacterium]
MFPRLVSVAVPIPALDLLTYRLPDPLPVPPTGARVVVPLGSRTITGIVLGVAEPPGDGVVIREIVEVLDAEAFLPGDVIELTRWVADYYLSGPGATLAKAMPPHALTRRVAAFKTTRVASLTAAGLELASAIERGPRCTSEADQGLPPLGTRQREALAMLSGSPEGVSSSALAERGLSAAVLARLRNQGLLTFRDIRVDRDPFDAGRGSLLGAMVDAHTARVLTIDQQNAVARLTPFAVARTFRVALLHGVTGSGKTAVYLELAAVVRQSGRGVLMLVPEIALTPAMATLFRARFTDRVAIQHSGLSDGERHDQWHRIRRGDVDVVVGTRSAVFAPLATPGLIIVDEEHDTSYKQEDAPRYQGRDVAIMRGKFSAALVVLGSATPSLESFLNASTDRYALISMPTRVLERPLARVTVVNMRDEYAAEGPDVVLSRALREAMGERLARREQAVILLNRRGYATAVFCRQCGDTVECPNCSVSLTVHRRGRGRQVESGRQVGQVGQGGRAGQVGKNFDQSQLPYQAHPPDQPRSPQAPDLPHSPHELYPGLPHDGAEWRARCHYCNHARVVPSQCPRCAAPYLEHVGFGTERVEAEIVAALPGARVGRVDRDTVQRRGSLAAILDRFARGDLDVLVGTQMIAKGHDFPRVTLVGVISADVGLGVADFRAAERTFQLLTQVAGRAGRGDQAGEAIVQTIYPGHYSIRLACAQDYRAFFEKEIEYRRAMHYPPVTALVNVIVRGFFLKGSSRRQMRAALAWALAATPELTRKVTVDVDPVSML